MASSKVSHRVFGHSTHVLTKGFTKDIPGARPASGSFSRLPSSARSQSNSLSLSATNTSHRVNRRKSVNAAASSIATNAIAAALREQGDNAPLPLSTSQRKSIGSRKNTESHSMNSRPSMSSFFNGSAGTQSGQDQDAVDDNSQDDELPSKNFTKQRNRRASEGSQLGKGESKKAGNELRCDTCGKGYKHSSCLTKHLWEHDPAWAFTSKLLISKHQQVQLLEAASVLCTMNTEMSMTDIDNLHLENSEGSSASPGYSGSSEMQDELSSVETTPPPMSETAFSVPDTKRLSASSTGFGRSYRSIPSSSFAESTISPGLPPQRFSGVDFRPSTSGTDDGSLAAATAGLSFNTGTPGMRPTLGEDIPPVPPLPQQYQSYNSKSSSSTLTHVYNPLAMQPPSLTQQISDERTYKDDNHSHNRDSDSHRKKSLSRTHTHLEEVGMFKMEE